MHWRIISVILENGTGCFEKYVGRSENSFSHLEILSLVIRNFILDILKKTSLNFYSQYSITRRISFEKEINPTPYSTLGILGIYYIKTGKAK